MRTSVLNRATLVLVTRTTPPADRRLVELLFGGYHRRILSLLLLHPDESFYVREIGRLTAMPAGSLHRELTALAGAGLLTRRRAGNQIRYQANRACPVFDELAGIFRKTAGLADLLRDALAPLRASITAAFVFGSMARGKERPTSDVDVMVIGDITLAEVVEALAPASQQLRREVNPVAMTTEDFRAKRTKGDRFVTRVLREPKVLLLGEEHELGELVKDRAA